MAIKTLVKKFWMKPENPDATKLAEFEFGYTEQNGAERKYKIEIKDNDKKSFNIFAWHIYDSKKSSSLPWVRVGPLKNKVKITNLNAEAIQEELPLRVARRFLAVII